MPGSVLDLGESILALMELVGERQLFVLSFKYVLSSGSEVRVFKNLFPKNPTRCRC